MNVVLGSVQRPLRVAIVGSGPSGFYAVSALFRSQLAVEVDMFDRLPSPFGLVRYGVAPDHPKIKNVIKVYEKEAVDPRFAFLAMLKSAGILALMICDDFMILLFLLAARRQTSRSTSPMKICVAVIPLLNLWVGTMAIRIIKIVILIYRLRSLSLSGWEMSRWMWLVFY